MKIPVFVSAPSDGNLSNLQKRTYRELLSLLDELQLERRALGRSDYPNDFPLREVLQLARRCSGGVVLGFTQDVGEVVQHPWLRPAPRPVEKRYPTPWNNLEAGILYGLGLPLVILREEGVAGGVFDHGVTDVFVHDLPLGGFKASQRNSLREAMLKWHGRVQRHYYDY